MVEIPVETEEVVVNKSFVEFLYEGGFPFINIYNKEIKNIYDLKKEKKKLKPKEEKDLVAKKQRQYFQYINTVND